MQDLSESDGVPSEVLNQLPSLLEKEAMNNKVFHVEIGDGESCYFLKLSLEHFYAVTPKIPRFVPPPYLKLNSFFFFFFNAKILDGYMPLKMNSGTKEMFSNLQIASPTLKFKTF